MVAAVEITGSVISFWLDKAFLYIYICHIHWDLLLLCLITHKHHNSSKHVILTRLKLTCNLSFARDCMFIYSTDSCVAFIH